MVKYFILKNTVKQGPLNLDELKSYKISKSDLIWKEGLEDWVKAEELPELVELIKPEIPKTPFEKKSSKTKVRLIRNFLIPVFIGLIMGFIAIASWYSEKPTVYKNQATYTGNRIETPYEKYMDKYLAGKYGYSALRDNEEFYYEDTKDEFFRPLDAILSIFNSKTQFYVGQYESAPFVSFILFWTLVCTVIYLIVFGIKIAILRANN